MRTKKAVIALLAGGIALVAGCSGSVTSGASSSSSLANGAAHAAGVPAAGAPAAGSAPSAAASSGAALSGAASPPGTAATTGRLASSASIIYTAQLTVRAPNVSQAAASATRIAQEAGGYVSQENTAAGAGATATVMLKIPVTVYPATLGQLSGELGSQVSLTEQAQDVTEQVADVNSQVTSDEAAIVQLRALLAHAGSVGDLLTVQNQINVEESSLEQMQAQQRVLASETSYATVTLTIVGPAAKAVVRHKAKPSAPSFTGAAKAGWHALRVTVSWVLAILAAIAPFAALVALAAFAAYRARRWQLRRRTAPPPPTGSIT
jgi:hypothetical protein